MKISEFVNILEGYQEEHGNVDVLISCGRVHELNLVPESLEVCHNYKGYDVWNSYLLINGPEK